MLTNAMEKKNGKIQTTQLETLDYRKMHGQPNQVRLVTLCINMKHGIFIVEDMLCKQPSSRFVEGVALLVYGLQGGRNILPSPGHLTSRHFLLWWINQGPGSHFQACDCRSLFSVSVLRMVFSLRMASYHPNKWKYIKLEQQLNFAIKSLSEEQGIS